ncbi:PREDICTED: uncharacterized protein LOC106122820 isoform X2 [Papilio xuthus]|uniref:Uncharacterized protein LOC106122820 isoform X2 n=1 Tax=Papilio xuthus TaxID=66420 RepID=A0AAJ7EEP2_PAPXU|nr:PREDICTED: uncharacterized protein LOC106122820 isoform X2 [Papilio xuthus]
MSDNEEPSAKHFKLQSEKQEPEDAMEEGHEEWLSEDVLSEDDYYQTSDYAIMSQDDTMTSVQECAENSVYHDTGDSNAQDGHERDQEENIEETLNNLENSQDKDFPDELGAFLIRKTDGKPIKKETEERESEMGSNRHTDDDGHDTDELLRMLGEDEAKRKKKPGIKLIKKEPKEESSDEDDDFIFGSTKVTRVKVAKNYIKKYATKAEPEDMSDKDELSDEVATMKSMFVSRRPPAALGPRPRHVASKSTTLGGINALQTVTKRVVSLDGNTNKRPMPPTSHRQVILKQVSKEESKRDRQSAKETEEIINEEEFLDEDEFDLDEVGELETDDEEGPSRQKTRQKIMRPERMDEEVPSDGESNSDESLYDEIQSSESEDLDEWFTLDIRAERAGDYLPLLGSKAKQLLIKERNRVGARLATLDQSLLALRDTGRQQAIQLRRATAALHHIDNALRAL